ncbi:MAG: hypothetical protein JNM83_13680 [Myxococcales bacterium]|nr:hypothetical protein [Myxococcales bacterium]
MAGQPVWFCDFFDWLEEQPALQKLFFRAWPASHHFKNFFSALGWPAGAPKTFFRSLAGQPVRVGTFFQRLAGQPALQKLFFEAWLRSRTEKDNFFDRGFPATTPKTFFQTREVQPPPQRHFFRPGLSSRTGVDNQNPSAMMSPCESFFVIAAWDCDM